MPLDPFLVNLADHDREIIRNGWNFFSPDGRYLAEFDAVTVEDDGAVPVEAKSLRLSAQWSRLYHTKIVKKHLPIRCYVLVVGQEKINNFGNKLINAYLTYTI